MIDRRAVIGMGTAALGLMLSKRSSACSLTATKPEPFNERICRREIKEFVRMLNEASAMSLDEIEAWLDQQSVSPHQELLRDGAGQNDIAQFFKDYRFSDGQLDPKPIKLVEVNLIRQRSNLASYQFTLRRHSYHATDPEGCNGMFTHGEYHADRDLAYIATFQNNRLNTFREFPEWLLDDMSV